MLLPRLGGGYRRGRATQAVLKVLDHDHTLGEVSRVALPLRRRKTPTPPPRRGRLFSRACAKKCQPRLTPCHYIWVHGVPPGFPRRAARTAEPVRRCRAQGRAEAALGRGVRGALPVPQLEVAVVHGQ